jgi:D-glycero-alpha-D-manno-heptose-7-phosphate kinase
MRFHASAPTRIDLAGGTLDIWPLYLFLPHPVTVNVAISRCAHAVVAARRDGRIILISRDSEVQEEFASLAVLGARQRYKLPLLAELVKYFLARRAAVNPAPTRAGLSLTTWSEVPAGSGLGGSSALGIAVCAALARWLGVRANPQGWIEVVRDLEARVLGVPTGEQDHYPAMYGGVNAIHLEPGATRREALRVPPAALESRLVLVYSGAPRRSGINNWQVLKNYVDGDPRLRRNLAEISAIAGEMRAALAQKNWSRVAALLGREWETRRRNAPGITTPFIDKLVRGARRAGAQAAKVCGAGGGGCVVFLCSPERLGRVAQALAAAGAVLLPFRIARRGVTVRREP